MYNAAKFSSLIAIVCAAAMVAHAQPPQDPNDPNSGSDPYDPFQNNGNGNNDGGDPYEGPGYLPFSGFPDYSTSYATTATPTPTPTPLADPNAVVNGRRFYRRQPPLDPNDPNAGSDPYDPFQNNNGFDNGNSDPYEGPGYVPFAGFPDPTSTTSTSDSTFTDSTDSSDSTGSGSRKRSLNKRQVAVPDAYAPFTGFDPIEPSYPLQDGNSYPIFPDFGPFTDPDSTASTTTVPTPTPIDGNGPFVANKRAIFKRDD